MRTHPMTTFTIALTPATRPLLAWTAVHGLTDLAQPNLVGAYLNGPTERAFSSICATR